jgi:uncharacterized membrane protein YccC
MTIAEGTPQSIHHRRFASWDFVYAVDMGIACFVSYYVITVSLSRLIDTESDLLGGMWAVVATVFVFKETRSKSLSAGLSRLIATCVSFTVCQAYLLIFPATAPGMAVLLAMGTLVMALLDRRDDIVTTGITTAVVMVVAAMSPESAWQQPILRFVDTVVGIAIGVSCKWVGSYVFFRAVGEPVR